MDDITRGLNARLRGDAFDPHESDNWQAAWVAENDNGRTESQRRDRALTRAFSDLAECARKADNEMYNLWTGDAPAAKYRALADRYHGLAVMVRETVAKLAEERDTLRADEYRAEALVVSTNQGGEVDGVA